MSARSPVYALFAVMLAIGMALSFAGPAAAQPHCVTKPIESTTTPPPTEPTPMGENRSAGLFITVRPDGLVRDVYITRSSGVERLDNAALAHVLRNWRYQPLLEDCLKAEMRANIYFPVILCMAQPLRDTHTAPETEPLEQGQERSAEMRVTVGADGKVRNVAITRSSGMPELDKAALEHVRAHWRWQPFVCAADAGARAAETLETLVSIDFAVFVPPAWDRPGAAP
jgi:TonB family protein